MTKLLCRLEPIAGNLKGACNECKRQQHCGGRLISLISVHDTSGVDIASTWVSGRRASAVGLGLGYIAVVLPWAGYDKCGLVFCPSLSSVDSADPFTGWAVTRLAETWSVLTEGLMHHDPLTTWKLVFAVSLLVATAGWFDRFVFNYRLLCIGSAAQWLVAVMGVVMAFAVISYLSGVGVRYFDCGLITSSYMFWRTDREPTSS